MRDEKEQEDLFPDFPIEAASVDKLSYLREASSQSPKRDIADRKAAYEASRRQREFRQNPAAARQRQRGAEPASQQRKRTVSPPPPQRRRTKKKSSFLHTKKGKIIVALLVILLLLVLAGGLLVNRYLGKLETGDKYVSTQADNKDDFLTMENYPQIYETAASKTDGTLEGMIDSFVENGTPVRSAQVVNVLLIGQDNSNLEEDSRSDAMVLMSLNKQSKKINMVSLLRDQYVRVDRSDKTVYSKLNHTNRWGGAPLLIKTFEQHYKIAIDNYVTVNFDSFEKIIDALDGVELNLSQEEANYLGTRFHVSAKPGQHIYNGAQALAYSRIRHLNANDSDVARVGRQRQVIEALMKKAKSAKISQLDNLLNAAIPYVRTGYTKSQLISLGTQALTNGWVGYDIQEHISPESEEIKSGGFIGSTWYWKVDYPKAAQELQMELYGKTNIHLAEDRLVYNKISSHHSSASTSSGSRTTRKTSSSKKSTSTTRRTTKQAARTKKTTAPSTKKTTTTKATTTVPSQSKEPATGQGDKIQV